jgi:hypothetical protein
VQTFTLDVRHWRVARVFGHNPLLRWTDRIEAAVTVFVIIGSLLAVPVAGAVGTAIYSDHHHLYAQEAQTRHAVTATVNDSGTTVRRDSGTVVGQAKWRASGGGRAGALQRQNPVKAGDNIPIWVDNDGNRVDPPPPTARAGFDAVGHAAAILLIVLVTAASLVAATRIRLDRVRDAQWEREIRCLADDHGGRSNRHYR